MKVAQKELTKATSPFKSDLTRNDAPYQMADRADMHSEFAFLDPVGPPASEVRMTPQQIAWAARHDWFVSSAKDGSVAVVERATLNGEDLPDEILAFSDFRALRVWAGY